MAYYVHVQSVVDGGIIARGTMYKKLQSLLITNVGYYSVASNRKFWGNQELCVNVISIPGIL